MTQIEDDNPARSAAAAGSVIPRAMLTGLAAPVAARDWIERRLVAIWERILKIAPIGVEDHWFDLGGDSVGAVALFAEITTGFCKTLPLSSLLEADTIAKLAARLQKPAARNEAAPIFNAAGKLPPLFCAHGVTGTATFALRLAKHIGPAQPIIGFQALYSAGEPEPEDTIRALAADYLEILRRHQERGPYRLAGWCVGSLIAFEMAQRLRQQGESIARLILVDPPVRPIGDAGAAVLEEASRGVNAIDMDPALREAMLRTATLIYRDAQKYQLAPYAGELLLLCSKENRDALAADGSEWRVAVRGRLVGTIVAPTHISIVGEAMPRVAFHVRRLLAAV